MNNQGEEHINININYINQDKDDNKECEELPNINNNNSNAHKRKPSAKLSNIGSHTKKASDIYQNTQNNNADIKKK